MSRASEGITTWPENWQEFEPVTTTNKCGLLTPAMNKPNATPSWPRVPGEMDVCAGLQRLPGEFDFENPSMNITAMMSNVELIPSNDVNESIDRGMKTVGAKLCDWDVTIRKPSEHEQYHLHDERKDLVSAGGVSRPDTLQGISR